MEGRREAEAHPRSLDAAPDAAGIERDVDSERLEHIGAPTPARGGPVSVLRHRDARAGRDERRRRRDVERAGSVAAGPAGVDRSRREVERCRVRPHRVDESGHLLDRLPLCPERDQQPGELARGRLARHHLVHKLRKLRRAFVRWNDVPGSLQREIVIERCASQDEIADGV